MKTILLTAMILLTGFAHAEETKRINPMLEGKLIVAYTGIEKEAQSPEQIQSLEKSRANLVCISLGFGAATNIVSSPIVKPSLQPKEKGGEFNGILPTPEGMMTVNLYETVNHPKARFVPFGLGSPFITFPRFFLEIECVK